MHHQLVEHRRELGDAGILLVLLLDASQGTAEAGLRLDVVALREVDVAQPDLADGLIHSVLGALVDAQLVVADGVEGVGPVQVDVSQGVIHLVEIVFVLLALRHALQHLHHLQVVAAREYLALADACGKLQLVGRIHANHLGKRLIGQVAQVEVDVELPQQVLHACPLLAVLLGLDGGLEVGDGLLILFVLDQVVGVDGGVLLQVGGGDALFVELV